MWERKHPLVASWLCLNQGSNTQPFCVQCSNQISHLARHILHFLTEKCRNISLPKFICLRTFSIIDPTVLNITDSSMHACVCLDFSRKYIFKLYADFLRFCQNPKVKNSARSQKFKYISHMYLPNGRGCSRYICIHMSIISFIFSLLGYNFIWVELIIHPTSNKEHTEPIWPSWK